MNMTGDPNQQNTSNLFGVNYNYATANPVDWTKFQNQPASHTQQGMSQFPSSVNFGSPTTVPVNVSSTLNIGPPIAFPQQTVPEPVSFSSPIPQSFTAAMEPVSFSAPTAPLTNYSFGTTDRPPVPVQFPFPAAAATTSSGTAGGEFGNKPLHVPLRCKRKTDSPPFDICSPPAVKQHITDEKMAEHMAQLHINSETVTSSVQPEPRPVREKRLYMCEEMRKLQQESILPQSLLNRISRPCTAVVLWTPPPRLPIPLHAANENNNEEDLPDNNVMDLDSMN